MSGRKAIFLTDIDNTLLYSVKHRAEGDVCVERIDGKPQGYMPARVFQMWKELNSKLTVIPVTTRSKEQYMRIEWPYGLAPRYAAVANGGILLCDGVQMQCGDGSFAPVCEEDGREIERLRQKFMSDAHFIRCRTVNDVYMFVYLAPTADAEEQFRRIRESTYLNVYLSGRKIYAIPPKVSKRGALSSLRGMFKGDFVIAAGDSSMDRDMLEQADFAIAPQELALGRSSGVYRADEQPFPLFVAKCACRLADSLSGL